ncbi:uncharacterized protein [Littorina saxatilis]|uniref:uncharacterized protein n=1 Tax=Littorina saxatilis TaxID=31220 RepID=UPI0038B5DF30
MKWTVTDKHNDVLVAASCLNKNKTYNCTAKDGFTATRENESTSELKITKNIREKVNKTLTCLRGDNAAAVKCLLRVVHPGELENPSVSIDGHFTVSGHVDISKVFASDSNVTCQWYYTQRDHPQLVSSTKLSLLLFTDNDLNYQRGVCNMTMQLNTSESADDFTVVVQPGHGPISAGTVNIIKPGYPQLQTSTCPKYLAEGSDLNCSCHHPASQQVSPAASMYWENRTDTAVLEVAHLSRELNGTEYVCSSVWAKGLIGEIRSSVAYTLLVAYGPATAELHVDNRTEDSDGNDTIRDASNFKLTCMYDEAFPSANFSWNFNCTEFVTTPTLSNCSLDFSSVMDVEKIECTAFNSEFPELMAMAYYTIPLAETGQIAENQSSDAGLAGGVSAAAVIALVVCIAILLFKRRQKNVEMHNNVCYQGSDEVHIQSIIEANSSNDTMSQNSPSAPPPSHSQDTSLTETGESTTRHDNINSGTQNDGAVIALGAENHTYAQVKKTKKNQKPAGAKDDMHNLGDNNPNGKQTQDMEPHAVPKVPSPLQRKEANAAGYHDQTGTEPRDDGTNNKAEMSQLKEKSQKMTPKGNNHETPGGHDGGSDSENVYSNCLTESLQPNPDTDVYINVAETTALANNQDNKVEQSAQINGCTNVQASQPQPTKHGDSNTHAQQQDAEKSTEEEDVYQNVTPEKHMGTNDDEYQRLQLSRQKQREDPTYSHLA